MRMLLSMYEWHGDVEPMVGPAMQSRVLGTQDQIRALQNFAELPARADVRLMPTGARR